VTASVIVHGGCVALWSPGRGWRGVLIQGPSGSGKSDLALRLLDLGFRLVSDDRTMVWRSAGRLFAACPRPISGLIEARGLGVTAEAPVRMAEVVLAVRCEQPPERLPPHREIQLAGGAAPLLSLAALEASAPTKVRRAMLSLGAAPQGAYLAAAVDPRGGSR
jgi:serine kinase of HPr protein (carbohydrate metabolism regulator)